MPADPVPLAARPRRSWAWRYRRLLLLVTVLVATAGAGLVYVLFQVPLPPPPSLEQLSQTTFLTDAAGRPLAQLHRGEDRVVVALDQVPPVVVNAVVATEDRNYFRHTGLDPVGLARATWADLRSRRAAQGGSTITQQYVKSTYVGRERSIWRKLKEAVIAVKLERQLDKREILERYLNTIYFGRGAYGVQAAAQAYFGKDVGALGVGEAAYLAGLIRSPENADASRAPGEAARRRRLALDAMEDEGYVSAAERTEANGVPIATLVRPREPAALQTRVNLADKGTQYFVDYVRRFLERRYGVQAVHAGGLRVRTTLDLDLQAAAYDAVYGVLDRPGDPDGALTAVNDAGEVVAMVGGRDWKASKVNLAVGRRGGGSGRQGGSAFKPFVLAATVEQGYTVESAFPAPASIVLPRANDGKDWNVANYEDREFGEVNLIEATAQSVNTVYAQLVLKVGPDKVVDVARRMGVDSPLSAVNSITLGTQDVSPLEMAEAYLTLATRGEHVSGLDGVPIVVTEVADAHGRLIERFRPRRERVLKGAEADVVTFALRQVVERGTGTGAAFGRPFAGKTGTTQNFGDAWFVGYTPRLSVAVWMGYPQGQAFTMENVHGRKVTGGSFPATMFRRFMGAAQRRLDLGGGFPSPGGFRGRVLTPSRIRSGESATTTTSPKPAATTPRPPPATEAPAPTTTTVAPTTTTEGSSRPTLVPPIP